MKALFKKVMAVIDDAAFMRHFNGWSAVFFAVLIIPALIFGWVEIVTFVSVLSIWALVAAHWSTWQAAKVEEKEDKANRVRRKPIRVARFKKKR